MAKAESITVAIESAIHEGLTSTLQKIADQHGIRVLDLSCDWIDRSTPGERKFHVGALVIRTQS